MAYEAKQNTGSLWLQPETVTRQDGTTFEAYNGSLNVDGKDYWLNGYKKEVTLKDGTKKEVMDLTVKLKQAAKAFPDGAVVPF
jgi:hypothetical protein